MSSTLPTIKLEPGSDHYAVMGNPVSHSLSPQIHHQFAKQTQQAIFYQAIEAPLDSFQAMVEQFRLAGGKGLNITVPFKQEAWELADQLSSTAKHAGAVNTIWFDEDNQIVGDNTDGRGMIRDIRENLNRTVKDKKVLVLGAGGAVRGVLEPLLLEQPTSCIIANRTLLRAKELVNIFSSQGNVSAVDFSDLAGEQFDLVINGTSASLQGELPPLPKDILAKGSFCYDMMYAKQSTPFVKWAKDQGAELAVDGLGMLIEQAAESFLIWRGVRPVTDLVIKSFRS